MEHAPDIRHITQLNADQINRYRRHLILPEVGMEGQKKLLNARVLCIGAGGLGCPIALYLAAAGVGTIGLVDIDVVSPSNLQRQILFDTNSVGEPKVKAAGRRLKALNPDVNIIEHETIINAANVLDLVARYDIIIDGTDNFPTRYCVNDACVLLKKPNIYGSIFRFEGMITVFDPSRTNPDNGEQGPCYRCLYPEPPDPGSVPSCAEGGVLGVLPGIIGTLQANEVIKIILGHGKPLIGRLTTFNASDMEFKTYKIRHDKECPVCGSNPTITEPVDYEQFCGVPALDPKSLAETQAEVKRTLHGAEVNKPKLDERGLPPEYNFDPAWEITPRDLKKKLDKKDNFVFIDCRLPNEVAITKIDGGTLIPLQQLGARLGELRGKEDEEVIVYCRSGGRSLQFAQVLKQQGFKNVKSMAGGVLLWNTDINPGGPQY
ncbi:MAG: molybdopterin-synthase adenylyltransferase MoeB [Tepidisphaeraceae bacterium]